MKSVKRNPELTLDQVQKLALTPDLLQSLSLLQMPLMELETYISQQLLENFMLEQEEGLSDDIDIENLSLNSLESQESNRKSVQTQEDFLFSDNIGEILPRNDPSSKTYEIPDQSVLSLQEHLVSQLHFADLPPKENVIGEFFIGNIDEDGYLRCNIREVTNIFAVSFQVGTDLLRLIQTFDPAGVGARDIAECLLLQLGSKCECGSEEIPYPKEFIVLVKAIIENHLQDIADGRLLKIAGQLKKSLAEIQSAVDLIRSLDPKPGRNFGGNQATRFIIPDVTILKVSNDYTIIINEPTNARLSLNPFYRRFNYHKDGVDEQVLKFIKDKQNAALQLIKGIEQRKRTLLHVTESIIDIQKDFLEKGVLYLKPLTLHQIADVVGIHESTVSRSIADKYIETPKGIYPFKFFFSTSLDSSDGKHVAAESVKKLIKNAVAEENLASPLSDQKLMELLKDKKIMISRRTVTKYREEMMIPSSDKRRRF